MRLPGGHVVLWNKAGLLFVFVVFLCVCGNTANAQMLACNTDPWPTNGLIDSFSIWPGDYVPAGTHCWCDGVPRVAAACYTPAKSIFCAECAKNRAKLQASDPICLATGNTFIEQSDIRIPGIGGGLTLSRTWNSILLSGSQSVGMFGPNWRSTYEEGIYVDGDHTVAYARGDGSKWNFVYTGNSQTFRPDVPANIAASLYQGSTTWVLTFANGEKRTFDAVNGKLLSIQDRNGNTTQLTYDSSYRLVTVTDPAGRHLSFSYASPSSYLVTGVSSDVGISLSYSYDSQGRLAQYKKTDGTTVSFQYVATNPILITAVLDSNGKILESHTYDSQNRGLTSARAGGVDAVTVSYPPAPQGMP